MGTVVRDWEVVGCDPVTGKFLLKLVKTKELGSPALPKDKRTNQQKAVSQELNKLVAKTKVSFGMDFGAEELHLAGFQCDGDIDQTKLWQI